MGTPDFQKAAISIGTLLQDHKAQDVVVLDLRSGQIWTDYFIIATVTSATHGRGLEKHVVESIKELGLEEYRTKRKSPDGEDWKLIDLGGIIVHLMTPTARAFYDLERLWYESPNLLAEK